MITRWNPASYAQNSHAQALWGKELRKKLILKGNERILDVGCGDGRHSIALAQRVPEGTVVGIDRSSSMIDFATRTYLRPNPANTFSRAGRAHLHFVLAEAQKLPFRDSFDVIFSNACLHWIIDHREIHAGFVKALRPGGRLLLQMGGKGNIGDILAAMSEVIARPSWAPYFDGFVSPFAFYEPREYRQQLLQAGLEVSRAELIAKEMRFSSPPALESWINHTLVAHVGRVPRPIRQQFITACVTHYLRDLPADAQGVIRVAMSRLEIAARISPPRGQADQLSIANTRR